MKNLHTPHRAHRGGAFLILALLCFVITAMTQAADVSVNAELSAQSTTTDQPVTLSVVVEGGARSTVPNEINASPSGLDIQYSGQQRRTEIVNFTRTDTVILTYTVSPNKPGNFTIQPIEIQAGGKVYKTEPLTLTVTQSSGGGSGNAGDDSSDSSSNSNKVFAELIIPKETAYVGEIIPAEIRYYFAEGVQFQVNPPGQVPQIAGEGFSKQRYPQPQFIQTEVKGQSYRVLIYKTAVVAAKSGDLTIGPAELEVVVSIPQNRTKQQRRRPNLNDPFEDFFGGSNPFFERPVTREMNLRTEPINVKIKPLPADKPADFTGAVGQFTLQTSAKPTNVKSGDPITLTSTISGRGNFDVVSAPVLDGSKEWRTYPSNGRLSSSDEMGITGDKIFDTAVIPIGNPTQIPPVHFSYFDPQTGKYVTLNSEPISVQVEGSGVPAATPGTSTAPLAVATPTPTPSATPANDILPIRTQWRPAAQTFTPIWQKPVFWIAQGIPFIFLLILAVPKILARTRPDDAVIRQRKWKTEHSDLAAKLASDKPEEFFPAAARSLELQTALKTGADHAGVENVLAVLGFEGEEAETAREIFRRRDEIGYGGARGGREISSEMRKRYESILR